MFKKVKSYPKGRKCRFPACGKILSIYNQGEYCHVHQGYVDNAAFKKTGKIRSGRK
ncbi:MAG: hypothetical protein WC329_04715 [Candidatus Omnitrophota bacterium]|jgi:hypothetical protein